MVCKKRDKIYTLSNTWNLIVAGTLPKTINFKLKIKIRQLTIIHSTVNCSGLFLNQNKKILMFTFIYKVFVLVAFFFKNIYKNIPIKQSEKIQ